MTQAESSQSRRLDRLEKSVAALTARIMKMDQSETDLVNAVTKLTEEINSCLAQLASDASVIKALTAAQANADPQFESAATSILAQVTRLQQAIASVTPVVGPTGDAATTTPPVVPVTGATGSTGP